MLQAIMEVDLVTVSSQPLKDYLHPYNSNIAVIPNFLDDNLWNFRKPSTSQTVEGNITIGYMGGYSHKPDLLMVLPALKKLLRSTLKIFDFIFGELTHPMNLPSILNMIGSPQSHLHIRILFHIFKTKLLI